MIPGLEPTEPKRNARDMLALLEAHYAPPKSKPPGGRLISEIQAPHSTRRADALYMPITTAGRGTIIGHEIKVSRADVVAEVRDPHKADAWMRYCTRWWLVVSNPAIIGGLDIPAEWGVMAPPTRGRSMTIVTKAPILTPDPTIQAEAWGTIFAKTGFADVTASAEAAHYKEQAGRLSTANQAATREIARLEELLGQDSKASAFRSNRLTVSNVLAEIERLGGYGDDATAFRGSTWNIDAEQVARMVLAKAALESATHRDLRDDVVTAIDRANRLAERMSEVLTEIDTKGTT
ncbi:hypothetical protein QDA00_gp37 [Microbacterium phage Matzah]|uniref:Uncharacterized protein n=1 Tax=Microbacterium phage Matzah TaxID=2686228 RepID=A0A6B9L6G7_9CAUD|nr:hypothetical protein QDA00_gp37 [Microbacterium phage Matzah]QHB37066.1 hypothetical protein SEA_MATZAH_73 [Microbacterium phage Matzah]